MAKKEQQPDVVKTKQEWIMSAAYLEAERFEVAGALFMAADHERLPEGQVKNRLTKYKGGV
ncbi:hypothetical protein [Brevibacillus agri]|uniref:hypothetical protein n=1 Tax=Brevibacillus agri TaxID=51101 RepID=UPI0024C0242D|nr:hypothetical protein [Brevibacillus agri]MED4568493.1 hypothetical protein [Brevibacillus agri]WHX30108.1 hypothetical protein QNK09_24130 [Brevibacillus agri]